jgi:glycosyltransferase involved in cell wall biosynthesis
MPKIAFVSPHCLVDFTNGAATATRDGLELLAQRGFQCIAFCGTRLDEAGEGLIQEQLFKRKIDYEVKKVRIPSPSSLITHPSSPTCPIPNTLPVCDGTVPPSTLTTPHSPLPTYDARLIFLTEKNLAVTMFENGSTRGGWFGPQEVNAFLAACELFLKKNRPDIVVTYGGDPVSLAVQRLAKKSGAKLVFWLHNFAYADRRAFELVDHVIVPSEFSRAYCRERLGLECRVLPNVVHWDQAEVQNRNPRYVTFINPQEIKGVYIFARIARELARRRPDIQFLVTQGRSHGDALKNPALGLEEHLLGQYPISPVCDGRNITLMPFTPDPQDFYPAVFANAKMLLMPSLWFESFGLVAAEAMLNGITVLASNRGALPETIGDAGFIFDIPARYTPETRDVPTAEEVAPWVETIIRLWDDPAAYDRASRAARDRAQPWHPDRLAPLYRDFFGRITDVDAGICPSRC